MPEEKTRVKDLEAELEVTAKDMQRALKELGLPAKTRAPSISLEDAGRVRDYFASRKGEAADKSSAQPAVIVRRRRREPDAEQVEAEKKNEVPETAAADEPVAPAAQARKEKKAESPQPPESAPASQAATGKKEPRPPRSAEKRKKVIPAVGARVISRPGDEKPAPEPVKEEPKPVVKAEPKKTLAQEIREREAQKRRADEEAKKAARERLEVPAKRITPTPPPQETPAFTEPEKAGEQIITPEIVVSPEAEAASAAASAEAAETVSILEKPSKAEGAPPQARAEKNRAMPDASAAPRGSSAPVFERESHAAASAEPAAVAKVRVISRPAPNAQPGRKPRPAGARPQDMDDRRAGGAQRAGFRSPAPASFGQPLPQDLEGGREGQSKKKRLKGRRTVDFQQNGFGRHPEEDDSPHFNRGKPRRKSAKAQVQPAKTQPIKAAKRKIRVADAIRVADMAQQMGIKANEIIKVLFGLNVMATINQFLDFDTASIVSAEFGYEIEKAGFSEEDYLARKEEDSPESLKSRPPVVTIMGHVDHGKTSLLDAVRKTHVTSGEAGGITQHIGAYHVQTNRGDIVFLDTPGHEAFTAMRARGAQITDLVILVVAADDGVMEQTREAINHSRAANVPIVVAVNKMDKPGADPDRVLRELSELGLQPEDWGGDTIVAKVSAKTRAGLDDLLEMVALQSEIMDLKANPDKPARGHIVEARLDKGRGPIATVLVQEGTLKQGDNFICGPFAGRVRALNNDQGKKVKEAGPSIPVEVQGFDGVPEAGEEFQVVSDDKVARRIAASRALKRREHDLASEARVTLETFLAHHDDQEALTLNLVLKADVQGSLEAISDALQKQDTDKVKISIVHGGTGAISESDILLAAASRAIIIGFNVRPTSRIKEIAERENVDIRYYDIIYKLVDDIKSAMAGLLAPVRKEVYLGQAEVRKVYSVPKVGAIAGSYVADGKIMRNAGARLLRDGVVVYTGKIASLKRFKDDAREVLKGNECGISLENFQDIKEGDVIDAFDTVQEAATL